MYSIQVSTPLRTVLLADILTAVLAHSWFRKYEPRNVSNCLLQLAVFAVAPVVTAVLTLQSPWVNGPLHLTLFVSFLLSSILLYRISPFHPLAKYPGPIICKITNLWPAWWSYKGKAHEHYHAAHKKYGPIVRIGPNELSVTAVDLIPEILGQQGMPKGHLWDGRGYFSHKSKRSTMSLISVRDLNVHAQLRKPWNRSFGPHAIQDYEETLIEKGNELIEHLTELCRASVDKIGHADLKEYINRWSFDFMGDIAFGEDLEMMRTKDQDGILKGMRTASDIPTITGTIPWAAGLLRSIPFYSKRKLGTFGNFAVGQAQKRAAKITERRDLFYHLAVNMDLQDNNKLPIGLVISNVILAIVAGSDTTSATLSAIMYQLIRNPSYFQRLREELDIVFPPSEQAAIQLNKLVGLQLLNAIVNEALRLQPPLPTGMQRAPAEGSGGKLIGDIFVREGTGVRVPLYALHRDPHYFYPNPDEFWPERWIIQSNEIRLNRSAFIPFSYGPANCVGKTLALSELRFITAMLVYHFDISFEDGYNPNQWDRDLLDKFTVIVGSLPVKLKQRVI